VTKEFPWVRANLYEKQWRLYKHSNNELPDLDRLLKHKQRIRKLWRETRDPACKTAVNWVTKSIRRMTRKKANETAACLEIQFTPHDLCDENHEGRVEATVEALLEAADNSPLRE
jgi:hypothetical protein